jgi:hypothetical protein
MVIAEELVAPINFLDDRIERVEIVIRLIVCGTVTKRTGPNHWRLDVFQYVNQRRR